MIDCILLAGFFFYISNVCIDLRSDVSNQVSRYCKCINFKVTCFVSFSKLDWFKENLCVQYSCINMLFIHECLLYTLTL